MWQPDFNTKKLTFITLGEEVTGPDDDEESMDWWTKYFASVDNMIEVILKYDVISIFLSLKLMKDCDTLLC